MKSNQSIMFGGNSRACVCLNNLDSPSPVDIEFSQNAENYIRICGLTVEQAEALGTSLLTVRQEMELAKKEHNGS